MRPEQETAIEEVKKIMKRHFAAFVLTYRVTDENLNSIINHDWHGQISDIVGLSDITHQRLLDFTSLRRGEAPRVDR